MGSNRSVTELDLQDPSQWLSPDIPLLIAGPCSAESEEQILSTATLLKKIPAVHAFRAGIWKPRTRPNSFQGRGEISLQWMSRVSREIGLKTIVEVATTKHIEASLQHGVDMLWIGARTVVNPFSVQELADALQGTDIPIFVKNPLVPDIQLWIGALERLNQAGIRKLIAVHRGFSNFSENRLRYSPEWEIPLELQRLYPNLPILCDPSHISGKREYIYGIAEKALRLNLRGLMIETHIYPDSALSDPEQQITPQALEDLLQRLMVAKSSPKPYILRPRQSALI